MPAHRSRKTLPYLALTAGVICISWAAIFVRWTNIPGPASAFYRLLIPAVVLLPTFFFGRQKSRISPRTLLIISLGGFFFALDLAFYNTAILQTSAANATLLGNNTPIVVGLLSWLIFRKRPGFAFWLGLALAVAGSFVILWSDLARHAGFGTGDVLSLSAAACFAVYLMVTEQVRTHTGTLVFLRLAIFTSTIFLFFFNLVLKVPLTVPDGRSWAALLGLGLVSQLGGYLALTYALGHLPATLTSVSLLSQGPLTALLAALLLAEPLSTAQIVGGTLVLFGVGLANGLSRPAEDANPTLCESPEAEESETAA